MNKVYYHRDHYGAEKTTHRKLSHQTKSPIAPIVKMTEPTKQATRISTGGAKAQEELEADASAADPRVLAGAELVRAAQQGDLESVRRLLPLAELPTNGRIWQNALHAAIETRRAECVAELLPNFDANAMSNNRRTALMVAAERGWAEGVRMLLPVSDAKTATHGGATALMMASCVPNAGGAECVRLLLPHSDAAAVDWEGQPALSWAALAGSQETVEALLAVSNPMQADERGMTALMIAALNGSAGAVEALIPVSDLRAVDVDGKTALDHAMSCRVEERAKPMADKIRMWISSVEQAALNASVAQADAEAATNSGAHAGLAENGQRPRGANLGATRRSPKAL